MLTDRCMNGLTSGSCLRRHVSTRLLLFLGPAGFLLELKPTVYLQQRAACDWLIVGQLTQAGPRRKPHTGDVFSCAPQFSRWKPGWNSACKIVECTENTKLRHSFEVLIHGSNPTALGTLHINVLHQNLTLCHELCTVRAATVSLIYGQLLQRNTTALAFIRF